MKEFDNVRVNYYGQLITGVVQKVEKERVKVRVQLEHGKQTNIWLKTERVTILP